MKNWMRIVPILLALALLAGCGQTAQVPTTPGTTTTATGAPSPANSPAAQSPAASSPAVEAPPVTNSPEPPAAEPSASEPPAVEPPVSEPPVSQPPASEPPAQTDIIQTAYIDPVRMPEEELDLANEAVALSASPPAVHDLILPEASGVLVKETAEAKLDYSNTGDGYVMVRYTAQTDKTVRLQVTAPGNEYKYDYYLTPQEWTVLPLSDGNGDYTVKVYRQNTTKWAVVLSLTFTVELKDEFAPFLRPNQYVDYAVAKNTLAKAEELMGNVSDPLEKVGKAYEFVVYNFTYDREKAKTVQSGYTPVLDDVLEKKTGICLDYAALMTGMLRSQGVPCRLVAGFAGTTYHAWINVWTEEYGWVDGVVYFDGHTWNLMDPTYASSASRSSADKASSTLEFIGNGTNYKTKFFY